MKKLEPGQLIGILANIGVIAGLVLVAYEVNQTGKLLEISASADGSDNFVQAMETLTQDEGLSDLIYRAEHSYDNLDDFEKWRVTKYLDGYMTMSEQDFLLGRNSEDSLYASSMEIDWRENMRLPMYREYWLSRQIRFEPEFREFIDSVLPEPNQ